MKSTCDVFQSSDAPYLYFGKWIIPILSKLVALLYSWAVQAIGQCHLKTLAEVGL